MAYLFRLICVVLCFAAFPAVFAFTVTVDYRATKWSNGTYSSTRSAACAVAYANSNAANAPIGGLKNYSWNESTGLCEADYVEGSLGSITFSPIISRNTCSGGAVYSGGVCSCPVGQSDTNGTCGAPNPCNNFGHLLSSYNGSVQMAKGQTSACMGGCQVNFKPGYEGADLYGAGSDGVMRGWVPIGQLQSADAVGTCGTPTAPVVEPVPDAERPPAGTCPGTMNGIAMNVPCSSTETKKSSTSQETDGDGNVTNKTENKITTCTAAGSCTTTVTTTTTVNGVTKTSTKSMTQGKGEFCAGNPGSKECGDGDGSSFGGSCQAGFVCDGDALQCAIAKEQHKRSCELFEKDNEERQGYEAAKVKGKAGTDQTGDLPGNQTINIGPGDFDSSDAIGGAQCITDKTVVIAGRTISVPLSKTCPYLAYLGQLLVVVGYLLGARILTRG
jgi:hypothetical protein